MSASTSRASAALLQQAKRNLTSSSRRCASTTASESASTTVAPPSREFNPVARFKAHGNKLPRSGYRFRPPVYNRGPMHPIQPLHPSDPASRDFIPGPFSLPRLEQHYKNVIASDMLALTYKHEIPGTPSKERVPRLRSWDDSSPYHKNRPLRGPRGGGNLRLLTQPVRWNNLPKFEKITILCRLRGGDDWHPRLITAKMIMQAISGVKPRAHKSKMHEPSWGLKVGRYISLSCSFQGQEMYDFLSKVIEVVMPKVKDWQGVRGSSGDSSGNIRFGLPSDAMALFPEIAVNYDVYPAHLIPGCYITVHTSATNDKDARTLLSSVGIPFHGKFVN